MDLYTRGSYLNISILCCGIYFSEKYPDFSYVAEYADVNHQYSWWNILQWDRSLVLFRVILAWPSEGILCDVLVVMMYFLKIVSLTWIHENILIFLPWLSHILETATSHARDGMSNRTGSGWESKSPARRKAVIGLLIVFHRAVWRHWA